MYSKYIFQPIFTSRRQQGQFYAEFNIKEQIGATESNKKKKNRCEF